MMSDSDSGATLSGSGSRGCALEPQSVSTADAAPIPGAAGCTIAEKDMPAPRLELRYRAAKPDDGFGSGYVTVCEYNFVFPLGKFDVRAEYTGPRGAHKFGKFKTKTVRIGLSATTRATENCYDPKYDSVNTPFRDGAHACWDSWHFGKPPIYAVSQGRAMLVENTTEGPSK